MHRKVMRASVNNEYIKLQYNRLQFRGIVGRESILFARYKSSLQLHRDRDTPRIRKINSALPIPRNPREFISQIHVYPRIFLHPYFSLSLSFVSFPVARIAFSRETFLFLQLVATRLFIVLLGPIPRRSLPTVT